MEHYVKPNHLKPIIDRILNSEVTPYEVIKYINSETNSDVELLNYFIDDFEEFFKETSLDYFFLLQKKYNMSELIDSMIEDYEFQIKENILLEDLVFLKKLFENHPDSESYTPKELIEFISKTVHYFIVYDLEIKEIGNIKYLYKIFNNVKAKRKPLENSFFEAIDLSDTTATEKIIYLHKLGVIDFLRKQQPFNTSINSLATVLSAVTGEKSGTIQPMLNSMLSKNVGQKNNPLNSEKPVNKVTKQLNDIGFESK